MFVFRYHINVNKLRIYITFVRIIYVCVCVCKGLLEACREKLFFAIVEKGGSQLVGCFEHGNKPPVSMKGGEFD